MKMGVLCSPVLVGHDKVLATRRPLDCSPAHTAATAVELQQTFAKFAITEESYYYCV